MKPRPLSPPYRHLYVSSMILAILLAVAVPVQGQPVSATASFLIIENPKALTIYNKYEQAITVQESFLFQPFAPMEIIEKNHFLSDNFTRCMIVKIGGAIFYLLKNDTGVIVNIDQAGYQAIFNNCVIHSDTVRVLRSRALSLAPRLDIVGAGTMLDKGVRVKRLFRKNKYNYVQTMERTPVYGWVFFSASREGKTWKVVRRENLSIAEAIPEQILSRIRTRIHEVNGVLNDLFSHLKRETGQSYPIPQWHVEISETRIICRINDHAYADRFSESVQYIVNDLDNLVRDFGFAVVYANGVITIQRK